MLGSRWRNPEAANWEVGGWKSKLHCFWGKWGTASESPRTGNGQFLLGLVSISTLDLGTSVSISIQYPGTSVWLYKGKAFYFDAYFL